MPRHLYLKLLGYQLLNEESGGETPQSTGGEAPQAVGEDITKLMNALNAEREARKALEKEAKAARAQLSAFSDIDPELARKAKQILAEQEEWAARESKIKAEIDQSYQPKLSELEKARLAAEQKLVAYRTDVALERAFHAAGGFQGEYTAIAHALRDRVKEDPTSGELKVYTADGKQAYHKGDPMTVEQLIGELKANQLWFARHFKGSETAGPGINGNGRSGANVPNWDNLDDWSRVNALRNQGQ